MKLIAWCSALLLLVGIAVGLDDAGGGRERDRGGPASSRPFDLGGAELASASNLRAFDDCVELLDYFREEATSEQLSLGFGYATDDSRGGRLGATDSATATAAAVTDQSGGAATGAPAPVAPAAGSAQREAAPSAEGDGSFSGTNLQEVDVDEPDTVKTDGEVIVAVAGTELHVIDPTADGPRLLGVVSLPQNGSSELLLTGDRVTVLTRTYGGMIDDTSDAASDVAHDGGAPMTVLTAVDIADPTSPQVVETTTFEGDYVSARMTGTLARSSCAPSRTSAIPSPRCTRAETPRISGPGPRAPSRTHRSTPGSRATTTGRSWPVTPWPARWSRPGWPPSPCSPST